MTIKIKIDLARPYEVAAFADFCKAVAAGQTEWEKANPRPDIMGAFLGGVSREPSAQWRAFNPETDEASNSPGDFVGTTAQDADTAKADNTITTGEADKRAVGEASGGRKRRTKDEIAADEALSALATAKGIVVEALNRGIGQAGRAVVEAELRKQPDATTAAISTGESRVGPEDGPEDDAETQAQDAADEAAEVEATRKADATIDDVKAAVQLYVDKFGMKNTQEDGPKIFVEALGAPPAGESFWKFSILPTDPEKLAHVVNVWKRAAAENPLKREAV